MSSGTKKYDYIIIGQGIAGTILGYILLKKGYKILIVNNSSANTSSQVAAGICNPVTGKKMNLTWAAPKLFPYLNSFYKDFENFLGEDFFHPMPIYRPYVSVEEQNYWQAKLENPTVQSVVNENPDDQKYEPYIHCPYNGFEIKMGGWLDLPKMLSSFKKHLEENGLYIEASFLHEDLYLDDVILWGDFEARGLIFCDGSSGPANPYFRWLPFTLTRGDILTLYSKELKIKNIVNKGGIFILPLGNNRFRSGATYDWKFIDPGPSEKGREEIRQKLEKILKVPFEIVDHHAGVRPAVVDRKPLLGVHPEIKNIFIFNGLGTKGVSLAPYFAEEMSEFLISGKDPEPTVNINRFFALYTPASQS
ncbi:MAG: NAD(P)/FAD-dependent oxidoreductase [Cytophagaceae bacterium]